MQIIHGACGKFNSACPVDFCETRLMQKETKMKSKNILPELMAALSKLAIAASQDEKVLASLQNDLTKRGHLLIESDNLFIRIGIDVKDSDWES